MKRIRDSEPGVHFDRRNMWHSESLQTGWATIELTFPLEVTLTAIGVHSQHSGRYLAAESICVKAESATGYQDVTVVPLPDADALVQFPATSARKWRVLFRAGSSNKVVIRGLRFYSGTNELFPPPRSLQTQELLESHIQLNAIF